MHVSDRDVNFASVVAMVLFSLKCRNHFVFFLQYIASFEVFQDAS